MKLQLVRLESYKGMIYNGTIHGVYNAEQCLVNINHGTIVSLFFADGGKMSVGNFDLKKLEVWEEIRTRTFDELFKDFVQWATTTFPEATANSSIEKLKGELKELNSALFQHEHVFPGDSKGNAKMNLAEEYIDCIKCLIFSASKAGIDVETLHDIFHSKLEVNKRRTWIKNPDNTYSHEKDR